MNKNLDTEQLQGAVEKLQHRIEQFGIGGVVDLFLMITAPLAPIGAQFLYVAQPIVSVFNRDHTLIQWAELLESPDGVRWLRMQLAATEENDRNAI